MSITTTQLENALRVAAKLVKLHGTVYLPIFERVENELQNRTDLEARIERALAHTPKSQITESSPPGVS